MNIEEVKIKASYLHKKRRLQEAILTALYIVPPDKYVTLEFIMEIINISKMEQIRSTVSLLTKKELVERHSLMVYRHNQQTHDKRIIKENWQQLLSWQVIQPGENFELLTSDDERVQGIKNSLTKKQIKQIDWWLDSKIQGWDKMVQFVEQNVIGPIDINASNPAHSVFRLFPAGREKASAWI